MGTGSGPGDAEWRGYWKDGSEAAGTRSSEVAEEALAQGSPNPVLLRSAPVGALTCPTALGGSPGM